MKRIKKGLLTVFDAPSLAFSDDVLRCCFLAHPNFIKSDGFIFVLNRTVLIHDGGMVQNRDIYDKLVEIKKSICPEKPLELIWVLSHYHPDHIGAIIDYVIGNSLFSFRKIFLPPCCDMTQLFPDNAESKFKPLLLKMIKDYQPQAKITELMFASCGGEPVSFELAHKQLSSVPNKTAKITLFPPDSNWSDPNLMNDIIINGYYDGDVTRPVSTCIINAASLWMLVSYSGRRMLFTGDSMKRTSKIKNESFDRMIELWSEYIGRDLDLLKWPHHGMVRNNALNGVMSMTPSNILVTTVVESASKYTAENCPDCRSVFFNNANKDVCVEIGPDGTFEIF